MQRTWPFPSPPPSAVGNGRAAVRAQVKFDAPGRSSSGSPRDEPKRFLSLDETRDWKKDCHADSGRNADSYPGTPESRSENAGSASCSSSSVVLVLVLGNLLKNRGRGRRTRTKGQRIVRTGSKHNLCSGLNLCGSPLREFGSIFALVLAALFFSSCATPHRDGAWIQTTDGPVRAETLGVILPHEHVFTDLRGPDVPGYGQAEADDVVRVMKPLLAQAKAQGVDLLVECTGIGVGRNAPLIARLAKESSLRIVVPTGVYGRANFAPKEYREMGEAALTAWMVKDITHGIDGTRIKAGFIKIASSETELKPLEEKFLRTAARAAKATGVAIASHTTSGAIAARQADLLREEGLSLDRFIWVHAQAERDLSFHKQLAGRGVYIELDSVGGSAEEDARLVNMVKELINAGHRDRLLLSHDAGWYNPGQLNGGTQRPYTALLAAFVPALRAAGFDETTLHCLIAENPRRAFALRKRR